MINILDIPPNHQYSYKEYKKNKKHVDYIKMNRFMKYKYNLEIIIVKKGIFGKITKYNIDDNGKLKIINEQK